MSIFSSQSTIPLLVFKLISLNETTNCPDDFQIYIFRQDFFISNCLLNVSSWIFNEYLKIYMSKVNSIKASPLYQSSSISLNALKNLEVFPDLQHSLISHHISISQSSWLYCPYISRIQMPSLCFNHYPSGPSHHHLLLGLLNTNTVSNLSKYVFHLP